ncbi:MAG: insulinase family protein [Pseudomonadota bacterium]
MQRLLSLVVAMTITACSTSPTPVQVVKETSAAKKSAASIVKHPRELRFRETTFNLPRATEYFYTLNDGYSIYLIEDRKLPLVEVSYFARSDIQKGDYFITRHPWLQQYQQKIHQTGAGQLTSRQLHERLNYLSSNLQIKINDEYSRVYLDTLSAHFKESIDMMLNLIFNPGFSQTPLSMNDQTIQTTPSKSALNELGNLSKFTWQSWVYPHQQRQRLQVQPLTTEEKNSATLSAISQTLFNQPGIFVITGDIRTEEVLAFLNHRISLLKRNVEPSYTARSVLLGNLIEEKHNTGLSPQFHKIHRKDFNQARVTLGNSTVAQSQEDYLALKIIQMLLAPSGANELINHLESFTDSTPTVGVSLDNYYDTANDFQIFLQAPPSLLRGYLQACYRLLETLRKQEVSEKDFNLAKHNLESLYRQRFEHLHHLVEGMAQGDLLKNNAEFYREQLQALQRLDEDDIQRVASKYLNPDALKVLVVGDLDIIEAPIDNTPSIEAITGRSAPPFSIHNDAPLAINADLSTVQ